MKKIYATAKLDNMGNLLINTQNTTAQQKKAIIDLLEKTNQNIYNEYMIINDFKSIKRNEYTFTIKYKSDLDHAIRYTFFDLNYDIDTLIKDYISVQKAANSVQQIEIDTHFDGMSKEDQQLMASYFIAAALEEEKEQIINDFSNKYLLAEEDLSFIAALAA